MPDYGHLESAPHQAPLSHGDREAASRLARQKRKQSEMNQRVFAYLFCILALVFMLYLWGW